MGSEVNCFEMWWPGTELNRRRQPFQGCALPPELPGHIFGPAYSAGASWFPPVAAGRQPTVNAEACGTLLIIATAIVFRSTYSTPHTSIPFTDPARAMRSQIPLRAASRLASLIFSSLLRRRFAVLADPRRKAGSPLRFQLHTVVNSLQGLVGIRGGVCVE